MSTHLAWLRIVHFRDVRPNTTLRFNPGWNVLLGRNATGKTTLLNLLSCILRSDFTPLREESFEIEFAMVSEQASVTAWLRHSLRPELSADPTFPEAAWTLAYRVTLESEGAPRVVVDSNGETATLREGDSPARPVAVVRIVDRPLLPRTSIFDVGRGMYPVALSWHDVYRFDEALETFYAVVGDDRAGREACTANVARIAMPEAPSGGDNPARQYRHHFFPMEMIGRLPDELTQGEISLRDLTKSRSIRLASLPGLLGFDQMRVSLSLLDIYVVDGQRWSNLGKLAFGFFRADGTMLRHDRLSFGQKRLLAFFYYLDANPRFVVADELVNGMHHAWIDACVKAMEGRQAFVTAQNPLLLDHLHFERREDVTHRFVLCRTHQPEGGPRETVWAHPDDEQADEVLRSYGNGVLQVHDILRIQGLW